VATNPVFAERGYLKEKLHRLSFEFASRAAEHDRNASFPHENFKALHAAGLLALTVPTRLGGLGGGLRDVVHALQTVGYGDAPTALILAMQYITHGAIIHFGNGAPELVDALGREAASEGALINSLNTERELGHASRGGLPATRATRTANGWRLNGRKIYATGLPGLRWALVSATTEEALPRIARFLVPMSCPGVRTELTWNHLGQRASGSDDLILEDVEIPASHLLDFRSPGSPFDAKSDGRVAAWFPLSVAAIYTGVAGAARDWLVAFLRTRTPTNLGAPLASLPRFQEAVGQIEALLDANRRLLSHAAAQADLGGEPLSRLDAGLLKCTITENAIHVVERAVALTSNHGLNRDNPLERHLRDVLCSRVHNPQYDAVFIAAGRAAFQDPSAEPALNTGTRPPTESHAALSAASAHATI
jgi:alkylation response protein AidB-like acyl-CoA dehydrogenase